MSAGHTGLTAAQLGEPSQALPVCPLKWDAFRGGHAGTSQQIDVAPWRELNCGPYSLQVVAARHP